MPDLFVYKASAGSGKTFSLTGKYLELLFRDPFAFRSILAVTFTNKAAGEMKMRILQTLFSLTGDNPGSDIEIKQSLNIPPPEIRKKASEILDLILNDFSRFSVGTIDRFFQLIIRSFTRETSMQGYYNLQLNDLEILSEAADNLLYEMDGNPALKSWMIRFADEMIDEGRTLDPTGEIIRLGREIFREKYRSLSSSYKNDLPDDVKIKEYSLLINKLKYSFENRMKEFGREFIETSAGNQLELSDFKNGSRSFAQFFKKICSPKNSTLYEDCLKLRNKADDHSEWYAKSSDKKDQIILAFEGGLNSVLKNTLDFYNENYRQYSTAVTISRFIYAFGILSDLSRNVRLILKESNLFLLSDSSQFLNEIIGNNDTPFIYEKAGIHYKNFMLDEFQDTSVYQWENFKPLISNSLSQGYNNLVVGDVKQSIYRWRNSDWDILGSGIEKTFPHYCINKPLNTNWRSKSDIVHFNNHIIKGASDEVRAFFTSGIEDAGITSDEMNLLAAKISTAYSGIEQLMPDKPGREGGYVQLRFFPAGLKKAETNDVVKKYLPEVICDLQDRGFKADDMSILVRNARHGKQIASILLDFKRNNLSRNTKYNFAVISNDSLYIGGNSAVQFLVALLKHITDSSDNINEAFLYHEYSRYIINTPENTEDPHYLFTKSLRAECKSSHEVFKTFENEFGDIIYLSLFELIEKLIQIFRLNEKTGDLPYIQAFQDIVLNYMQKESSDLSSFLNYWNETGSSETLNISEKQDAITIMTIHKAKGLEFRVVIIPYCDWNLDHDPTKNNVLWCETTGKSFDFLPFVPVKYSPGLKSTYFSKDYQTERMLALVDNLNLLYVALTRARDELFIFSAPSDIKDDRTKFKHIGDVLLQAAKSNDLSAHEKWRKHEKDGSLICEFGHPGISGSLKDGTRESLPFDFYPVSSIPRDLKIRYHGSGHLPVKKDLTANIDYGIVMHEILSRIRTREDIPVSVVRSVREGKIDINDKDEIIGLLDKGFSAAVPPEFFSPGWQIYTEREILTPEGNYRPDRIMLKESSAVVIDFKFGLEMKSVYHFQLKNYIKLIRESGFVDIKGYIWYFTIGRTEEVRYEG